MSIREVVDQGDSLAEWTARVQDKLEGLPDLAKGCLSCCVMAPVMMIIGALTFIEVALETRQLDS